jgi:hypothetical protein
VSAKHPHRKHSWARLRLAALDIISTRLNTPAMDVEVFTLLLCILGASLAGLVLATLLHLWRGLVG